jgi:hypothetical protein
MAGAALILLASSTLQAQELSYGGQVTLSLPESNLGNSGFLDSKVGGGVGLNMAIAFPGGHTIVPRIDYTVFQNSSKGDAKAQMLQVGADYDYYLLTQQANDGVYVGLGLGYGSTKFQQNTPSGSLNDTPNNIYFAAQAGCMFTRNFGAELRYTYAEYKPEFDGAKSTVDAPTLNASFICRF